VSALVLLVDDDVKILRLLEATLRLKDFGLAKCETAAEALWWLKKGTPDLIISDTDVPDLDGFDLFRRVRGMPAHVDVPFIFLSADGEPEDVARGLRAGADEYLRKPFAIDELLVRVVRVLEVKSGSVQHARPTVFSGSLADMSVPDLLRMLSVQRQTGLLEVTPANLAVVGLLQVVDGRVTNAEFGLLDAVPALFALMAYERGRFSFDPDSSLGGDSIGDETLPLLMEGLGLIDSGMLPRIDPRNLEAVRTFCKLVNDHRRAPVLESVGSGEPLRLEEGREPGQLSDVAGGGPLETGEFQETQRLAVLTGELEMPTIVDSDEGFDVGLSTADFAPGFLTGEIEALEDEARGVRRSEAPTERVEAPREPPPEPELTGQILIVAGGDDDDDDDFEDFEEFGVALVDDTIAEGNVRDLLQPRGPSPDVMGFYETIKGAAKELLGAVSIQLGTRQGRVIASSIPEITRRDTVAQFSSQAIMFAAEAPDGTSFASLDAGDLHVVVLEVDHLRVLTLLFQSKPDPTACVSALSPYLEEYRAAR